MYHPGLVGAFGLTGISELIERSPISEAGKPKGRFKEMDGWHMFPSNESSPPIIPKQFFYVALDGRTVLIVASFLSLPPRSTTNAYHPPLCCLTFFAVSKALAAHKGLVKTAQSEIKEAESSQLHPFPTELVLWTVDDVCRWLDTLQLGEYKQAFREGKVRNGRGGGAGILDSTHDVGEK